MSERALPQTVGAPTFFTFRDSVAGAGLLIMTGGGTPSCAPYTPVTDMGAGCVFSTLVEALAGGSPPHRVAGSSRGGPDAGRHLAELAQGDGGSTATTGAANVCAFQACSDTLAATRLFLVDEPAHLEHIGPFLRSPRAEMSGFVMPLTLRHRALPARSRRSVLHLRLVAPRLPASTSRRDTLWQLARLISLTRGPASATPCEQHPAPGATITRSQSLSAPRPRFPDVGEIVDFCCRCGILCQGASSAANRSGVLAWASRRWTRARATTFSSKACLMPTPSDIAISISEARRREEVIRAHLRPSTWARPRGTQVAERHRPIDHVRRCRDAARRACLACARGRGEREVPATCRRRRLDSCSQPAPGTWVSIRGRACSPTAAGLSYLSGGMGCHGGTHGVAD